MGGLGNLSDIGNSEQQYALKWNDFHASILSSFRHLRDEEDFIDVTIACDGCSFTAHKVVLSACSPYFRSLLKANPCQHPIVILRDVREQDMEALLRFMYNGEVHIGQEQLPDFLKTAQSLQVRGLAEVNNKEKSMSHSVPWSGSNGDNNRRHHRAHRSSSSDGQPLSKKSRSGDHQTSRYSESPPNNNNVSTNEHLESSKQSHSSEPLSSHGDEPSQQNATSNQMKPVSERSSQMHSSNEDSNSYDDDGSDADIADRPSSVTDLVVHPKLEPPDYAMERSRSDSLTLFDQQRQRSSYSSGLFNIQGLTAGLIPGPSGVHSNSSESGFGIIRRSSDSGKVRATDPRPCPQCGKIYRSAHTLRTHLEDKHTICPGYRCVLCGTVAKSRNSLHSHMSRQHRGISTKDLPVLPMPSPFDPELAAKLYSRAGVNISPAELRARASPTGTITPIRRGDNRLDMQSDKNGSGEEDPQDLSVSSKYSARGLPDAPLDFHLNAAHNFSKLNSFPPPFSAASSDKDRPLPMGTSMLDAYFQLLAEGNYMTQEQVAEMSASAKLATHRDWSGRQYRNVNDDNDSSSSQDEESLSEDEMEPIKAE